MASSSFQNINKNAICSSAHFSARAPKCNISSLGKMKLHSRTHLSAREPDELKSPDLGKNLTYLCQSCLFGSYLDSNPKAQIVDYKNGFSFNPRTSISIV